MIFKVNVIPPEGNSTKIRTIFCFNKAGQCVKYYDEYWGKELAVQKIDEARRYSPQLKKVKNSQKWIDVEKGFEMNLIPVKIGKSNFASVYIVEFKSLTI
ncbi:MAG: hypothetical protein ABI113_09610 [Mucilaginibacter sp.]